MIDVNEYLKGFYKGTKNPSLKAMKYFMNIYNNFEKKMKFIHIAGTNGKGSCVEIISNILVNQGYKVGKFISPHLIRYNERISINGKKISDEESIKNGLQTVIHKGRMEKLNDNPIIVFDGAHNEAAIENFKEMVKMYYSNHKRVYIISILKTKDYKKMLKILAEDDSAIFILTSGDNSSKFLTSDELYDCIKEYVLMQRLYKKDLEDAITDVMISSANTVNFVVGSFYVYGIVVDKIKNILK